MRFRLTLHDTTSDNKYDADTEHRHEMLGDRKSIWFLWYTLTKTLGKKHVEVFDITGMKQNPEQGLHGMADCQL